MFDVCSQSVILIFIALSGKYQKYRSSTNKQDLVPSLMKLSIVGRDRQ